MIQEKYEDKFINKSICVKSYCIVIPPPNITGSLHMGHAFQCTLMDILIRYYSKNGFNVLWKMGVDHAGIATQLLIEQKFLFKESNILFSKAYRWKKKSYNLIKKQLLKLNCSLNFNTSRFTLDKHFSYSVNKAFTTLYYDNLIYKSETLVNWDVKLKSAISDLEVIYKEEDAELYSIKYFFLNSDDYIVISTTRPETIFADTAIAVNPKDSRYKSLLGKQIKVPLTNRVIPLIFEESVDINFGSGCLKITPCHDFNDFVIGRSNNLDFINIMNKDGTLNDLVPNKYRGKKIEEARKLVIEDLSSCGFLLDSKKYKTKIPRGDRTNSIIEPYLTSQWYIKTSHLIVPVLKSIKNSELKIIPFKWTNNFIEWCENIKDWCISRQIWWGHKIPVWYDVYLNMYVGESEKDVRKKFSLHDSFLKQETDVLDTWFSSALWPFASLGWPNCCKEYNNFYPVDTLVTGFDIIFFWAIRMLMFGLKFTNKLPFKEVYIHGLIRDFFGAKMSKTKGNVIDPIDIIDGISYDNLLKKRTKDLILKRKIDAIEKITKDYFPNGIKKYGVDVIRLMFLSMASDNMFLKIDLKKLDLHESFCIKLLNASKFINGFYNTKIKLFYKNVFFFKYNIWIISLFQHFKKKIVFNLNNRSFFKIIPCIYDFFWYNLCDWYFESLKKLNLNSKYYFYICHTLKSLLFELLILLYPIIPNLTQSLFEKSFYNLSILKFKYPKINKCLIDIKIEKKYNLLKKICIKIRNIKSILGISKNISMLIKFSSLDKFIFFEKNRAVIQKLSGVNKIYFCYSKDVDFLTVKIFDIFFYFLDFKKSSFNEILLKKIKKLNIEKDRITNHLSNANFVTKALPSVIQYKRNKLKDIDLELLNLNTLF